MPSTYSVSPGGSRVEGQVDLLRENENRLRGLQAARVGDRERYSIARIAAEIMPLGRDRQSAARHTRDGRAGMYMALVQEVDVPGEDACCQCAVLDIGRAAAVGDHVARAEGEAIGWPQYGCRRPVAGQDIERGGQRGVGAIGHRKARLIGAGDRIGVRRVGLGPASRNSLCLLTLHCLVPAQCEAPYVRCL